MKHIDNTPRTPRWLRRLALVAALAGASAAGLTTTPAAAQEEVTTSQTGQEATLDLNTATLQELTGLPGIGDAKARAIIERREQRPFQRVEEIMRVRGIGRATFRRLRPMLRVGPPSEAEAQR